jgi:hypothetical protein
MIKESENTDKWHNVCRDWRIEKEHVPADPYLLVVHSGSDGVSVSTRSSNNGFVHLDEEEVLALIKELERSIKYSKAAKAHMADYWEERNRLDSPDFKFKMEEE